MRYDRTHVASEAAVAEDDGQALELGSTPIGTDVLLEVVASTKIHFQFDKGRKVERGAWGYLDVCRPGSHNVDLAMHQAERRERGDVLQSIVQILK